MVGQVGFTCDLGEGETN